jgi:hypothetical protein
MNGRFVLGILLVLVLLAGLVGIGVYAYNVGVTQGLAQSGKLVAPVTGVAPYPFYGRPFFFHPFGFGFGFLGCLFPLLFFFLVFSLFRGFWWRGHMGWSGAHGRWGNGVPPRFEEWHRQAHGETQRQSDAPQSAGK